MYKIYKIVDNTNGNIYIGRTIQPLKRRLSYHKCHSSCSSREIIKNGDYKIMLIEETDDKTRERYWIENTECVNKEIPGRTAKEYQREYNEKNKQKIKEWTANYGKKYREENREKRNKDKKRLFHYQASWGGDHRRNNNLLQIDVNLLV